MGQRENSFQLQAQPMGIIMLILSKMMLSRRFSIHLKGPINETSRPDDNWAKIFVLPNKRIRRICCIPPKTKEIICAITKNKVTSWEKRPL